MYSILLDAEFDTKQIQQELDKVKLPTNGFNSLSKSVGRAQESVEDLNLTFNVANDIFQKSIDTIGKLVGEVTNLDSALVEFKKVSDLSGSALDNYVEKLSTMGRSVARTGKPNRSEPGRWDGKPAPRTAPKPLKASRALSLQHKDEIRLSVNVRNH